MDRGVKVETVARRGQDVLGSCTPHVKAVDKVEARILGQILH